MISESFYDILGIKYDWKTFQGRFSGITKSWPVGMLLNKAKISTYGQISKFFRGVEGAGRDEAVQFPICVFIYMAFPDI